MRILVSVSVSILLAISLIYGADKPAKEIDPEIYLKKADDAVKIDPDRSMDLSKTALMFLRGSDNEYLEIKAKLIIGKAYYYKNEVKKALKTMLNVKARITIFQIENRDNKYKDLFAESFFWFGEVYRKLNRYKKALESYLKGIEYCRGKPGTIVESKLLIEATRMNILLSEFETAMNLTIKSARSAELSGDVNSIFFSQYLHGYIYREMREYAKANLKFKVSLNIAEKHNRVDLKIMALNEISNISTYRKEYDKALSIKEEALKLAEQTKNLGAISYCLHDIALIFQGKREYNKAIPYLIRSKKLALGNGNVRGQVVTDRSISETYLLMGKFTESRKTALAALKVAEKHELKYEIMALSKFLSEIEMRHGNPGGAYEFLKRSFDLNQEIFSIEKSARIAELEAEIEIEKSESRILLLEKINEIKQLELDEKNEFITIQKVATLFLIIIVVLIFLAYRLKMKTNLQLRKKSEELEKTLAEIHKLSGLLPICSSCKKIRDDGGYWHQVEEYIKSHSDASFSHSLCPVCIDKVYPGRKNGKKVVKKRAPKKKK